MASLRTHWEISCFEGKQQLQDGECLTIEKAARALGIAPSTLHRWLNAGFIAGEQITPGAPWRIRVNDELRSRFVERAPEGYVKMFKAMNLLCVSRQTILQRVKRGELKAVHVYRGRAKGIRIQVPAATPSLTDTGRVDRPAHRAARIECKPATRSGGIPRFLRRSAACPDDRRCFAAAIDCHEYSPATGSGGQPCSS